MRYWRIRGIGGSPAADPEGRPAVPDQRAQATLPARPAEPGGRHCAPVPDQAVASDRTPDAGTGSRSARSSRQGRSIGRFTKPAAEVPVVQLSGWAVAGRRSAEVSIGNRTAVGPGPGSPFADAVRGFPPCPLRVRSTPTCADLDRVLSDVREIAVWAGREGSVQDTGRFLLRDGERMWHAVPFGGAQGAELIARMRGMPGFDTNLLLDAVSARSGQIEPLWPPRAATSRRT